MKFYTNDVKVTFFNIIFLPKKISLMTKILINIIKEWLLYISMYLYVYI